MKRRESAEYSEVWSNLEETSNSETGDSHKETNDVLGSIFADMASHKTEFHHHHQGYVRETLPSVAPSKATKVSPVKMKKERVAPQIAGLRERAELQAKARSLEEQEKLVTYGRRQRKEENKKVVHFGQADKEKQEGETSNKKPGKEPDEGAPGKKNKATNSGKKLVTISLAEQPKMTNFFKIRDTKSGARSKSSFATKKCRKLTSKGSYRPDRSYHFSRNEMDVNDDATPYDSFLA